MDIAKYELDESSVAVKWFRGLFREIELQDDEPCDYDSLKSYLELASSSQREVLLKFKTIEHLIGGSLPNAAFHDRLWWSNIAPTGRWKHTGAWLNAGCVVTAVQSDRATGWVRFRREAEAVEPFWMSVFAASLANDEITGEALRFRSID